MNINDAYEDSCLVEEVTAVLQLVIQHASHDEGMDSAVMRHLQLASHALEAEKSKRMASIFNPSRTTLSFQQLARVKTILSKDACQADVIARAAQACNMSYSHFERCFKNSMGSSPRRLVTEARMDKARQLLLNTSSSILEIAGQCGYSEQCHFTRVFSRETGMSPGAWRRLFRMPALRVIASADTVQP
jgi:AraC-like DNA-binding protein